MKTDEQLRTFYEKELRDDLREVEILRSQARKATLWALLGIIGAALSFVLVSSVGRWAIIPIGAALAASVVFGLKARNRYSDFHRQFKQRVIGSIIRFLDPEFTYQPDRHISETCYRDSGIFRKKFDRYRGDDFVAGRIDKTEFVFSELHTEYKTTSSDSKGNQQTHWHTIFKGLFFSADFNKYFRGSTYVLPDTAERLFGFLGSTLQGWNKSHGDLVQLEDPDFEEEFVVYGSDQVEARYILSPSLMERILEFRKKAGTKIHLSFTGSRVNLAVPFTRDLFETSLFGHCLDYAKIREYTRDLQLAFGIVTDLNLNTRIWSKA